MIEKKKIQGTNSGKNNTVKVLHDQQTECNLTSDLTFKGIKDESYNMNHIAK